MKKSLVSMAFFLTVLLTVSVVQTSLGVVSASNIEKSPPSPTEYEEAASEPTFDLITQAVHEASPSPYDYLILNEYVTTVNQTLASDQVISFGNNVASRNDQSDSKLRDTNSSTHDLLLTDKSVITNSHTGIDHHFIKALPYWTKGGHWFPKADYSQIRYQVSFGSYIGYVTFTAYVKVQSGADTISRYWGFILMEAWWERR